MPACGQWASRWSRSTRLSCSSTFALVSGGHIHLPDRRSAGWICVLTISVTHCPSSRYSCATTFKRLQFRYPTGSTKGIAAAAASCAATQCWSSGRAWACRLCWSVSVSSRRLSLPPAGVSAASHAAWMTWSESSCPLTRKYMLTIQGPRAVKCAQAGGRQQHV